MNLKKEITLLLACARIEAMDRMEALRAFIFVVLGVFVQIGMTLVFFQAIYLKVDTLGGWNYQQMQVLLGTYFLIEAIGWMVYIRGFGGRLFRLIESGDLDLYLIKPVNLKSFLSYRFIDVIFIWPQVLLAVGLIFYGAHSAPLINFLGYLFFQILAFVIHFSIILAINSLNFFLLLPQANWMAYELFTLGQYPITIFRGGVKLFLSFIFPVAIIYSLPPEILFGQFSWRLAGLAILFAILFYLGSHLIWRKGLNRYESARG